jgi:secreted PhoX family phosphatase
MEGLVMKKKFSFSRRDFVKFMGGSVAGSALAMNSVLSLSSCSSLVKAHPILTPIKPSYDDDLILAPGFKSDLFMSWGDKINSIDLFGFNNDYIAFIPIPNMGAQQALLWVNHEYIDPIFVSGFDGSSDKTKEQAEKEMYNVGGSIVHIKKNAKGRWDFVKESQYNRRITGLTDIPFSAHVKVKGKSSAMGTLANCAGGVTPWGTVLTCEENYDQFYGETRDDGSHRPSQHGWEKFYNNPPEHYGWVVEIDPWTGKAKKHTSMGRMAHECATCVVAKDGRTVVYTGDDKKNEFIYKFISDRPNDLSTGELFVANLEEGKWISLDIKKQPVLQKHFKDQVDVHTHCRKAGRLLGATHCDRPEDFEVHPITGHIYATLTNNYNKRDLANPKNNFHGTILRIQEKGGDYLSLEFESDDFLVGGEEAGFSCPDNLVFDKKGNLWMCSDISGSMVGKEQYKKFKNNGLFYIPTMGEFAGEVYQVASAPVDAELTGCCFSHDEKTLFLSVQHPGERTKSLDQCTSHWPFGAAHTPKPSVVQIYGETLEKLTQNS